MENSEKTSERPETKQVETAMSKFWAGLEQKAADPIVPTPEEAAKKWWDNLDAHDSDIPPWERENLEDAIKQKTLIVEKMDNDFNLNDLEKKVKDAESIDPWSFGESEQTSDYLPRKGGEWTGKPGDSTWKPDKEKVPENPLMNPERKTWREILDTYGIDGIPFKDGEPDFSEVSKGTVEIDDFSDDRDENFDAADEKLAEQRGCTKEEVRQWRIDHHYTWHERSDMKTMDKVPTEVHGNVPHEGGISAKKMENENG